MNHREKAEFVFNILRRYIGMNTESQEEIEDMINLMDDGECDPDDRDMGLITLAEIFEVKDEIQGC